MKLREVISCSTAPTVAALGTGSVTLHDIQSGTQLACFKQTSSAAHSTAIIQGTAGLGGLILTVQPDKSILNVYNFQKEQIYMRIVLPEKLSCMTTDTAGRYCAGGTSSGRIYLWEIASGILFNSFEAHYRRITVIRFTTDGAALLSGSEDSGVSVWSMAQLLNNDLQNEIPPPYCFLPDHTLPITDIACGVGTFPFCRVMTSSADNSCKLWDLSTKSLLTTFMFPRPITMMAFDPAERSLFAGAHNGSIHQVNLYREVENSAGGKAGLMEAVGGGGPGEVVMVEDDGPQLNRLITIGHELTSMALSMTGSTLVVGTANGTIHLYDVASHQLVKTINTHQGFRANHVSTFLKPPDLIGHITLGSVSSHLDAIPVHPIASFHRIRDAAARATHEVPTMMHPPPPASSDRNTVPGMLPPYNFESDYRYFTAQSSTGASGQSLQSRVAELEAEVADLRQNLASAKGLNDSMWESVVSTVLGSGKVVDDDDDAEGGTPIMRSAKRAKVNGK